MLSFSEALLSMPSQERKIIWNKKVSPWLAFLICLSFPASISAVQVLL